MGSKINPTASHLEGPRLKAFITPRVRATDIANRAGVSLAYLSAVLAGRRPASPRIVAAAIELGLPAAIFDTPPQPLGVDDEQDPEAGAGRDAQSSRPRRQEPRHQPESATNGAE